MNLSPTAHHEEPKQKPFASRPIGDGNERKPDLTQWRQHADAGRLDEALAGCRSYLDMTGPNADALSLMGVVHLARLEQEEAIHCFRKALYLCPDHPEALTHVMLLAQREGDQSQAAVIRARLNRSSRGGEP